MRASKQTIALYGWPPLVNRGVCSFPGSPFPDFFSRVRIVGGWWSPIPWGGESAHSDAFKPRSGSQTRLRPRVPHQFLQAGVCVCEQSGVKQSRALRIGGNPVFNLFAYLLIQGLTQSFETKCGFMRTSYRL